MAHFHTDMERFDVHDEVCEIVAESATIGAILESGLNRARRRRDAYSCSCITAVLQ
jgi:hypothetical protein